MAASLMSSLNVESASKSLLLKVFQGLDFTTVFNASQIYVMSAPASPMMKLTQLSKIRNKFGK